MSEKFDVIVIGAGLSGLLSGSLLSQKGLRVGILEKNNEIGGMIQPFKRKGFFLDTGMNFFGAYKEGQIQDELFDVFGVKNKVDISDIPEFELIFNDKKYCIPSGFDHFYEKMTAYFPDEKEGIREYIDTIKKISVNIDFKNINENKNLIEYYSVSASGFIRSLIRNEILREILKFNKLLFGNDFDKIPLYIYAAITGSFLQSTGMFTNGTKSFISELHKILSENKVQIFTNKEVAEIIVEDKNVSHCICTDNSIYNAYYFLSTLHPQNLLPKIKSDLLKSFYRERIAKLPNSKSTFIINVVLRDNEILFDEVPKFINSYKRSVLFYYPVSGKTGKFSKILKIMCTDDFSDYKEWSGTKTGRRGETYKTYVTNKTNEIFKEIEHRVPNLRNSVKKYFISSPLTLQDYTFSPAGSSYGLLKNYNDFEQSIIPVNTKFDNLFLAGQSINFHGLLGVSITVLSATSIILNKFNN